MYLAQLGLGLLFLVGGAELLVRGASRLAAMARISALVIGLTIVAYGTSAPELAVSVRASLAGDAGLAVGNVVGSNIFNVLVILGITALVHPFRISSQLVRFDVPILIGVSLLVWGLSIGGAIGRVEGALLVVFLAVYTAMLGVLSKRSTNQQQEQAAIKKQGQQVFSGKSFFANATLVLAGLATLGVGAQWFVTGATTVAEMLGVTHLIIGLTIVAAGTSLPELATSIWASLRGERDIAVGNIIGSNIFNLLGVLGFSALLGHEGVEVSRNVLRYDMLVMVAVALACLPIFITGATVSRLEGFFLVFYYGLYITILVLDAINSPLERPVSQALAFLFIPMTVFILIMSIFISEKHLERMLGPLATDVEITAKRTLRQIKRLLVLVIGGTLVILGLAMIFLPGPATVVIPLG
ncbi:MAG: calcium/sodium antiporter, partial [Candidatus Hydrogenedentota bacterium]